MKTALASIVLLVVVALTVPGLAQEKLGKVTFPTSCDAKAQAQFERGVAMLHSYWFTEARKVFDGVVQQDPKCAMGYWGLAVNYLGNSLAAPPPLAADWPDPRGFIPPPPCVERPAPRPQYAPIMTHTRIYHGQDAKFTERLATYYYLRDDARFGGWPAYLERPGDFIRFCCYLHVTETLAARGGTGDARVLWRWPIRRYER